MKNKSGNESKSKSSSNHQPKKKIIAKKRKLLKQAIESDNAQDKIVQHSDLKSNFSLSNSEPTDQVQMQVTEIPPSVPTPAPVMPVNPSHYGNSLNLIAQSQPMYQPHPGLNISHHWLDLDSHNYTQVKKISLVV